MERRDTLHKRKNEKKKKRKETERGKKVKEILFLDKKQKASSHHRE